MPEMARKVTLDLRARKLYVDGAEFPWLISSEGPELHGLADKDSIRSVTLTFFTEDVEVIPEGESDMATAIGDHISSSLFAPRD